jgi:hypothetical protein
MDTIHRHARAQDFPLTPAEISAATQILESGPVCIATVQRRLAIGWNRAADLVAHIKGADSLPLVARHLVAPSAQQDSASARTATPNDSPREGAMTLDDAWGLFSVIAGAVHQFSERHPLTLDERQFLGNLIRDAAWKARELPAARTANRNAFEHWYAVDNGYSQADSQHAFTPAVDETEYQDAVVQSKWIVWQAARMGPR